MVVKPLKQGPTGSNPSAYGHHGIWAVALLLVSLAVVALLASCPVTADSGLEGSLALGPFDDDRGPIPSMTVELTPDELVAVVTEALLGAVTFDGTAHVEQPYLVSSTVTIQCSIDTGWPVVVSPTTFDCTGPSDLSFHVTVIAPPAASCETPGTVALTATMKIPGLSPIADTDNVIVTVTQYCGAEIWSNGRTVEVSRNDDAAFELFLLNTGNGPSTYLFDTSHVPDGVTVTFSSEELELGPDENRSFEIKLSLDGTSSGMHTVEVRITTLDMEGSTSMTFVHSIQLEVVSIASSLGSAAYIIPVLVAVVAVAVVVAWKQGRLAHLDGVFKRFRDRDADGGGEDGYLSSEAEDGA